MNKKQVIESAFNYCSTLTYDEDIVDTTQQEVDNLLGVEKTLDVKKVRLDERTSILTIDNLFKIKR